MSGCEPTGNGAPIGNEAIEADIAALDARVTALEGAAFEVLFDGETTDATPEEIALATLPVIGAGVFLEYDLRGEQDNGARGLRAVVWLDASRNATGTFGIRTGNITTGHTSVGVLPWSGTIGFPAGWTYDELDFVGNSPVLRFGGDAGQTVRWRLVVRRLLIGGATP